MTETHTPLPWTFEAGVEDNEGEFYVCHAGTVCTETTVCNPHSEADARFIVQAVNSHHRLIEAAKGVMDILGRAESNASGNPEFDYVGPRVAAFRAALKEAVR